MAIYKILFVDEVEEDIRKFQRYVHKSDIDKKFELITLTPENTLENLMEKIRNENFDAIITDYILHEYKSTIEFNGVDLVREILNEKNNFPCFILTSWDKDAVINGDDTNMVYLKNIDDPKKNQGADNIDGDRHATFLDKIENQIIHYKTKIKNAQNELLKLISKSEKQPLNAEEEAKLLVLDTFIEKSTNQKSSIPKHLKGTKNLDELHKMIDGTNKLLEELKKLD